ncbi:hypothetical protein [Geminocystis sp. NIES-3709]|uniref:hypothetical protein n=1 Tax=Geminocystis sp. NIES-3709 TaxID=1617448 RepID=UPI0011874385|nr:hypothetical protein [Geminocystis sp. NIES-3709]
MVETVYVYADRIKIVLLDNDSCLVPHFTKYSLTFDNASLESLSLYDYSKTKVKIIQQNPHFECWLVNSFSL